MTHPAGTRLLVVDDDEGMRETLSDILEDYDLAIELASNGQEAVNKTGSDEFDLVLMDVKMPVMDGIQALQEIKTSHPQLPVILMTAHADSLTLERARTCGATAVIGKPLDLAQLLQLIIDISSSD